MSWKGKHLSDLAIPIAFWLPFRKRFTRDEYSELFRILRAETRALMRRPTYVLGVALSAGLAFYYLYKGLSGADWPTAGVGVLILLGYSCGINSTREHLCERLLRLKQHPEELQGV